MQPCLVAVLSFCALHLHGCAEKESTETDENCNLHVKLVCEDMRPKLPVGEIMRAQLPYATKCQEKKENELAIICHNKCPELVTKEQARCHLNCMSEVAGGKTKTWGSKWTKDNCPCEFEPNGEACKAEYGGPIASALELVSDGRLRERPRELPSDGRLVELGADLESVVERGANAVKHLVPSELLRPAVLAELESEEQVHEAQRFSGNLDAPHKAERPADTGPLKAMRRPLEDADRVGDAPTETEAAHPPSGPSPEARRHGDGTSGNAPRGDEATRVEDAHAAAPLRSAVDAAGNVKPVQS